MTLFKAIGATGGTPKSMVALISTAHYLMTLESPVDTDYQVPVGKTFKVTKIMATINGGIQLGYGDNGVPSQAANPDGYVILMNSYSLIFTAATSTSPGRDTYDVYFEIPAEKYPFVRSQAATAQNIIVFGIEE